MPWTDWQFWLVTIAALWGLCAVVRQLVPRRGRNEPPCSTCAVGMAAQAKGDASESRQVSDPVRD